MPNEDGSLPKLQSVLKALNLLKLFASKNQWRMKEIVEALEYHKSSVQRLLHTLETEKFIEKVPESPSYYRLGVEAIILGNAAQESLGLRAIARPYLQELVDRTQETAHMGVVDDFRVYYVEKIDSPQELRMVTRIGQRVPIHTSSMGKSLLAYMDPEEIEEGIRRHGLVGRTGKSLTSRKRLDQEMQKVRQKGFAFDDEEWVEGVRCIGAPIFNGMGKVIAAVSISAPAQRITKQSLPRLSRAVKETAQKISARLGYVAK